MPDARLRRARATLPKGYQYGDAGVTTFRLGIDVCETCGTTGTYNCPDCGIWRPLGVSQAAWRKRWRPLHENAAEQLKREAEFRKKYMEPAIEHTFNAESPRTRDEAV